MSFRIPVLETFIWQKEIHGFINDVTDITNPEEGNRFIIINENHAKYNHICSYTGTEWIYDSPRVGMTTIVKIDEDFDIYCYSNEKWELYTSDKFVVLPTYLGNKIPEYDPIDETPDNPSTKLWTISRLFQWLNENISTFTLGYPTDGRYDDGLFSWTNHMRIEDVFDDINTVLKDLVPEKPQSINSQDLKTNTKIYPGFLCSGIQDQNWYSTTYQPGTEIKIVTDPYVIVDSPSPDVCFGDADKGTLSVFYSTVDKQYVESAIYDLKNNFITDDKRGSQDLSKWDGSNPNSHCFSDGVEQLPIVIGKMTTLPFNNKLAKLKITDVSMYNNFYLWQKGKCQVEFLKCTEGCNSVYLQHDLKNGNIEISNSFDFFYDSNKDEIDLQYTADPFTITDETFIKTLSGITYYTTNTPIKLTFDIEHAITNVYSPNDLVVINLYNNIININANDIPNSTNGVPQANSLINVDGSSVLNLETPLNNLTATVSVKHPFKQKDFKLDSDKQILYIPEKDLNTPTSEFFTSEKYRIRQTSDFSTIVVDDSWDSSLDLSGTDDAVIYFNKLQHSISDDLTQFYPNVNTIDYSNKSGKQFYIRKFYSPSKTPFSSIVFDLDGINVNPLIQCVAASRLGIGYSFEIKLPGSTAWLDAGLPFDKATFDPNLDGCGCRDLTTTTSSKLGCTFGTADSSSSDYTIYVRIAFNNSTISLNSICTNWS